MGVNCVCVGDVLGVINTSRDMVEASFSDLCDEMTSVGWHVTPVLLAADDDSTYYY